MTQNDQLTYIYNSLVYADFQIELLFTQKAFMIYCMPDANTSPQLNVLNSK